MVFCKYCGKEIHESALVCPNCGGVQQPAMDSNAGGLLWIPIASMVLGILSLLTLFSDSPWDKDTVIGAMAILVIPSIVLGGISLNKQKAGRIIAILGIVLASITLIVLFGISNNLSN